MADMSKVTEPKSDQLNADSLIGGPITITITSVDIRPKTEQPATVHYSGEDGRPYKPCLSMRRLMMHVWGPESVNYVGKSMTLYNDPDVTWGGQKVGGIRISHMSGIPADATYLLTTTKGQKKPYKVKPLSTQPAQPRKTVADYKAEIDALDLMGLAEWQEANASMGESESPAHKAIWSHAFERGKVLAAGVATGESI